MYEMDSLDWNEWVAVKKWPVVQKPTKSSRLFFNVAWNEIETKLAISCREGHRVARDSEFNSWATIFSLQDLVYIHQQLCNIQSQMEPALPNLPICTRKLWSYVTAVPNVSAELCGKIEKYLQTAVDLCGKNLVVELLFKESENDEQYFEDMSEVQKKGYEKALETAKEELSRVLKIREDAENMLQIVAVYKLEDEVMLKVNSALVELYNYLLQPFLDLRESAHDEMCAARKCSESVDVGPRVKEESLRRLAKWHKQYVTTIDNIRALYIEFYKTSRNLLKEQRRRMIEDEERFGKATFEVLALPRLDKLDIMFKEENLKYLRAQRLAKEHERDKTEEQLLTTTDTPKSMNDIESDVYSHQVEVLQLRLKIFHEETELLKKRIAVMERQRKDASEIGVFYDAVQTEDDIEDMEDFCAAAVDDPKLRDLKTQLATVSCKRAKCRNKLNACIAAREKIMNKSIADSIQLKNHHSIHLKREATKREYEQRKDVIESERQKTLQRLRQHRLRYPAPKTLKAKERESVDRDTPTTNSEDLSRSTEAVVTTSDRVNVLPSAESNLPNLPPPLPTVPSFSNHPPLMASPPPPPPPPPPPLLLPPPPPPSFPRPAVRKVSPEKKNNDEQPTLAVFTLQDVIQAKQRLRKFSTAHSGNDEEESANSNVKDSPKEGNPFLEAMERIRRVMEHSDDSVDSESDTDFS